MKNNLLVFFGAPGVGKGTQAKIISKKLQIPHISTGDILRKAIKDKTELGIQAKKMIDNGRLVHDDIIIKLVEDVLKNKINKIGFILDGFPRTLQQAEMLQPIMEQLFSEPLIIFTLDADEDIIINRLAQRRICNTCQSIVNLNFLKDNSKCPTCGSINSLIKRKDDEIDVIKDRLEIFKTTTKPVLEYYENRTTVHHIDGTLPVEEITKKIINKLS